MPAATADWTGCNISKQEFIYSADISPYVNKYCHGPCVEHVPELLYISLVCNLIVINVTHISMLPNYSFKFGRNVTKHGRNMERCRERNIAEPKFELKSFHPSCIVYGRGRI